MLFYEAHKFCGIPLLAREFQAAHHSFHSNAVSLASSLEVYEIHQRTSRKKQHSSDLPRNHLARCDRASEQQAESTLEVMFFSIHRGHYWGDLTLRNDYWGKGRICCSWECLVNTTKTVRSTQVLLWSSTWQDVPDVCENPQLGLRGTREFENFLPKSMRLEQLIIQQNGTSEALVIRITAHVTLEFDANSTTLSALSVWFIWYCLEKLSVRI